MVTSIEHRRQFKKSKDKESEIQEMLDYVKEVEGALARCCSIARLSIEKYDKLYSEHQDLLIDFDDVQ